MLVFITEKEKERKTDMKKIFSVIMLLSLFALTGCVKIETLHCDMCGCEVYVNEKRGVDEDWQLYCDSCYEESFSDDTVLAG